MGVSCKCNHGGEKSHFYWVEEVATLEGLGGISWSEKADD